jgi:arylsulfatase A-like enzyme
MRSLPLLTPERESALDAERQGQLEMLQAVDELLGRLREALEDLGVAENTLLVFTSDNGMAWGEHRYFRPGKLCPGEECVRIPLVIRYPHLTPLGHEEDSLVSHVDLAPLLAQLAGAKLPPDRDGRPELWRTLDGTLRAPRENVLFEVYTRPPVETGIWSWVGLRTDRWKYVEYATGESELYDLTNDPWELRNLARRPRQMRLRVALRNLTHARWPGFPQGYRRRR